MSETHKRGADGFLVDVDVRFLGATLPGTHAGTGSSQGGRSR